MFMPSAMMSVDRLESASSNVPRLRILLAKFNLVLSNGFSGPIKYNESRAGGSLIYGSYEELLEARLV